MKNTVIIILALGFLSTSCKKDERPTYLKDESGVQQTAPVTNNSSNVSLLNQSGSTMITSAGMNPPHGEPGHRCDIPVGQPLNSKPASQPVAGTIPETPVPTLSEQKLAVGEKPTLNPPHGEPFHDCAVKVGDPLP